jgi:hypothetical protein
MMTLTITTFSIMTLRMTINKRDTQYRGFEHNGTLYSVLSVLMLLSFILSVTNKTFMLSVNKLGIIMLSVIIVSVIFVSSIMLSVIYAVLFLVSATNKTTFYVSISWVSLC